MAQAVGDFFMHSCRIKKLNATTLTSGRISNL